MGRITFIIGGARSGKSRYAARLADNYRKVAFIATGEGRDDEMRHRIHKHRKARPSSWKTFEEPLDVCAAIRKAGARPDLILIDCLTLLVSNLLGDGRDEAAIEREISRILAALDKTRSDAVIVSNEVGFGIVPANKLARDFRDIGGRVNQMVAERADEVYLLVSGLPIKIKG
jgi:adenosylcobinamide kinase/adenosylcobinamide-phosphate guanylyltransferase